MKKLLALILALALVFTLVGCGAANSGDADKKDLKVGFIFLHDEQSTYDKNFMDAATAACEATGV